MIITQFQFTDIEDDEKALIKEFCNQIKSMMVLKLNTKINRKKISLRLNYIEENANWITWNKSKKYNTSVQDILTNIVDAIIPVEYKDNLWKIEINSNILIPNSYTSIDRLIRFINYGDNVCAGTGMFTKLEQEYGHHQLNAIWNYFIIKELGHPAQSKIIAR